MYFFIVEIKTERGLVICSRAQWVKNPPGDPGSVPGSGRSAGEGIGYLLQSSWASLVAQLVKNPPAVWETWVRSLAWEDPLEKEMQPTPVLLPGKFHGQRSLVSYSPRGRKESGATE